MIQNGIVYLLGAAALFYIVFRVRRLLVQGEEEAKCKACAVNELQKRGMKRDVAGQEKMSKSAKVH